MHRANDELKTKFTYESALEALIGKANIFVAEGEIKFRNGFVPSKEDYEAVDYFCQELGYKFIEGTTND